MNDRRQERFVTHGSWAEADTMLGGRELTVGNSTRYTLYAIIQQDPYIHERRTAVPDTVGQAVPQEVFEQHRRGSDGAQASTTTHQERQPTHDRLPDHQQVSAQTLEQMVSASDAPAPVEAARAPADPYYSAPQLVQQPALEVLPGAPVDSVDDLERITGMDQNRQRQLVAEAYQGLPDYSAAPQTATPVTRVPEESSPDMAAEARRIIDELDGLGYENLGQIAGASDGF